MRKRPWNRVNSPVYSVSSRRGAQHNMHICTYATAISMQPKRYIVGLFKSSQTLDYVSTEKEMVLQILADHQFRLVNLLGKQSGRKVDKIARLEKRQLLSNWQGFRILKECIAVLHLKVMDQWDAGDHVAFLCELVTARNLQPGPALSLDTLRINHIIRS